MSVTFPLQCAAFFSPLILKQQLNDFHVLLLRVYIFFVLSDPKCSVVLGLIVRKDKSTVKTVFPVLSDVL